MQSKRINRNFTYSPSLKRQAVNLYLNGHSCSSICEQLEIQDPKRIYVWTKAYQERGELAFIDNSSKIIITIKLILDIMTNTKNRSSSYKQHLKSLLDKMSEIIFFKNKD